MSTVADKLTARVARAAREAGHGEAEVEACVPTNNPAHGDYQSNFAFRLGRSLRTNPRALAEQLRELLLTHAREEAPDERAAERLVADVQVAGPGFLNFRLGDVALAEDLLARALDSRLGAPDLGRSRKLVIDYSSPNIAKRMHVGHLRSTVIGHALDRLYRFLGWEVVADNHIGDWGTQFGKLIVMWRRHRDEAAYAEDPIGELQRLYQRFGEEAAADPALEDVARAETVKLQQGVAENVTLWQRFVEVSMQEFQRVYDRMDIRFDVTLGESFYRDELGPLVDELLDQGAARINEGAVIIELDEPGLEETPMLIRKRDGGFLYGTTDLATVKHRLRTWDPARIVYVTDVRQKLHFRQVFAACRKLGLHAEMVHVWFGMLRLPGGQVVASRTARGGPSLNLVDVLDTAVARAREVVDQKSGHLDENERAAIAEAVGVGAVRYADLSQNPQSDVVFEWDKMLALEGNTAPYLMYAYARCQSIFRKAALETYAPARPTLDHPAERELALAIVRLPEVIVSAAESARPNLLCDHLFGLANTFARFYGACRVLGDEVPPEVRGSRLALVHATARALKLGLGLLGIRALDRM